MQVLCYQVELKIPSGAANCHFFLGCYRDEKTAKAVVERFKEFDCEAFPCLGNLTQTNCGIEFRKTFTSHLVCAKLDEKEWVRLEKKIDDYVNLKAIF